MIEIRCTVLWLAFLSCLLPSLKPTAVYGQAKDVGDKATRQFSVEIDIYSVIPSDPLNSYRKAGSLGARIGGTAGTSIHSKGRGFNISATGKKRGEAFLVDLSITESGNNAAGRGTVTREFDLSDLHPEMLELDRDPDGRVYRLNIVPQIDEQPPVKLYRADELELDHWSFQDSAVILNDQDYLGTLGMAGGNLASVQVPGLANIEFSLTPLIDSEPEGIFQSGTVMICHGDTTLAIRNVRTGLSDSVGKLNAFKVFVRWKEPTESLDQVRKSMKEQLQQMKSKQEETGDESFPKPLIEKLQRMVDGDRVMLLGGGMRNVLPRDIDHSRLFKAGPNK